MTNSTRMKRDEINLLWRKYSSETCS